MLIIHGCVTHNLSFLNTVSDVIFYLSHKYAQTPQRSCLWSLDVTCDCSFVPIKVAWLMLWEQTTFQVPVAFNTEVHCMLILKGPLKIPVWKS